MSESEATKTFEEATRLTTEDIIRLKSFLRDWSREDLAALRNMITEKSERERDIRELWLAVRRWGIISVLTALAGAIWFAVKAWVEKQ